MNVIDKGMRNAPCVHFNSGYPYLGNAKPELSVIDLTVWFWCPRPLEYDARMRFYRLQAIWPINAQCVTNDQLPSENDDRVFQQPYLKLVKDDKG